uniref:double-stranded RNA-binding protein 8 isoform X2 n=1 Tax=Erigeron canadensis TaxID=72917 RepID=UPI001CB89603|nr:double-stranded RNA-binding protein 8 isoform X2 [Erigeron canadensis]XP_043637451.1 double-stranded RNA-binding protein 8 isoform X2 [Erigeron canadensis]
MEEQQQSVSSCYVFKSRLQEYAQKAGLTTPIYHTIKEGPSHQPIFRSTVVINDETYHSLAGFLNRKASEQSAAEVALVEIAKTGATDKSVSHPVHETGLCKNLLQEYAQKMNYAIPSYVCTKDEKKGGRDSSFSCTVDIGGIKYIGTSAKTKKEAELKAAKTALLAIKMSSLEAIEKPDTSDAEYVYTVVPTKRKAPDRPVVEAEVKVKKGKRRTGKFHKRRKKRSKATSDAIEVKTDKPSVDEDKDMNSNGETVFVPCSNNGKVINLNSNRDSVFVPRSNPGEVQDWKSDGDSVFLPCSNLGEAKDLKSKGKGVLVPCSSVGETKGSESNGEHVLIPSSNLPEVKDLKSNGKSVLVACSSISEGFKSCFSFV